MKFNKFIAVTTVAIALTSAPAAAKQCKRAKDYQPIMINNDVGVPVFAYDIKDRKYEIIEEVKAGVRKATVFSEEADQAKIYRELWERADKLCADAVINAKYGDSKISLFSWGKTNATGTAIRFVSEAAPSDSGSNAAQSKAVDDKVADTAKDSLNDAVDSAKDGATAEAPAPLTAED